MKTINKGSMGKSCLVHVHDGRHPELDSGSSAKRDYVTAVNRLSGRRSHVILNLFQDLPIRSWYAIVMLLFLLSCNDSFLDRYPTTSITPEVFFRTESDLELYVVGLSNDNTLNSDGWGRYEDLPSDNVTIGTDLMSVNETYSWILKDFRSPLNAGLGEWNKDAWKGLRAVNLLLSHVDQVTGNEEDISHYVGIARYYRASFYIDKVLKFSSVPWIDRPLSADDELLYAPCTPRAELVTHIIDDLEFASSHILDKNNTNKTNISRYCALALLSRFALYEGTFRKYHSELELGSTSDELLRRSATASLEIMNSGSFSLAPANNVDLGNGIVGSEGFRSLFSSFDLGSNPEIIKWVEFDVDRTALGANRSDALMNGNNYYSMSRSLQESFLTRGGLPYSSVSDYDKKEYTEVFIDRDPRLAETISYPGASLDNEGVLVPHLTSPVRGGYDQIKFFVRQVGRAYRTPNNLGQYNGLPIYRYGEVLLNYAEAKAELGEFDGSIADQTINLLRARVEMPSFDAAREVDATLRSLYPDISDVTLLAIRRERRVELAGEGLRLWDINRWAAGAVFELDISKQGIYVPSLPYRYDVTGDGIPDVGIVSSESLREQDIDIPLSDPALEGGFYRDTHGFLRNGGDASRRFLSPKHYYRPIPQAQLILNPQLTQPPGW